MFRIIKKERGFIVEKEVSKWTLFGIKKTWIPFVLTSGMNSAWHHSSYGSAMRNLISQVETDTILNDK